MIGLTVLLRDSVRGVVRFSMLEFSVHGVIRSSEVMYGFEVLYLCAVMVTILYFIADTAPPLEI